MSGLTILRQSWQTKTQFLFSWIRILNRVSCWREHWWHDFITRTWIPILHLSFHSWEMRSEKPLESLSPTIPSLSDPSWDHERVSTSLVQTHIETRWVDLLFLHVRWSLLHISEWYITFTPDHSDFVSSKYFSVFKSTIPICIQYHQLQNQHLLMSHPKFQLLQQVLIQ